MNTDTDYSAENALHEQCLEHICRGRMDADLIVMCAERDSARAEVHALRVLVKVVGDGAGGDDVLRWGQAATALSRFGRTGSLSASALLLAADLDRLEQS